MRGFLRRRNHELLQNIGTLLFSIQASQVPEELQRYRMYIVQMCERLRDSIEQNQIYLQMERTDILEDVLSRTQQFTQSVRLLSSYLSIPILRASSSDRLALSVIYWLHQTHPRTSSFPPAFAAGQCSISLNPPIYYFSAVEQQGLLYQPLLFHEFGHLLYLLHKPEMDDLVAELREEIIELLMPASQRNDRYAEEQASKRQIIANTWYSWIQEIFCDAVGFEIGGPCFLYAFSSFLSKLAKGDFYRQPDYLNYSEHPTTWLRVRFLSERAAAKGFKHLAEIVENEWRTIAEVMDVIEDYHGFYHEALEEVIRDTIRNMLTETSPRECTDFEAAGGGWSPDSDSLIRLLNWSWQVHISDSSRYSAWEAEHIALLLT